MVKENCDRCTVNINGRINTKQRQHIDDLQVFLFIYKKKKNLWLWWWIWHNYDMWWHFNCILFLSHCGLHVFYMSNNCILSK